MWLLPRILPRDARGRGFVLVKEYFYRLRNNDIGAALGIQVEDVFTRTGGCGCDLMGLTAST